ncbi:MAG: hypothetical protein SangKO_099070 [Sandaracinaceae bacterium]
MDATEKKDPCPPPQEPGFSRDIALALSGGGYRAAAFHLGVLDLLDRVGLLSRVTTVSTISGGTIVGAAYAVSLLRNEPFPDFYKRFYAALRDTNVVDAALADLEDDHKTAQGETAVMSLSRAAARVYARDEFVGDARMGDLRAMAEGDSTEGSARGPSEWVFSATELTDGTAFRFQTSSRNRCATGGGSATVPKSVADTIRVADAVAASSCFPGAFEPLGFPHDFVWDRPLSEVCRDLGTCRDPEDIQGEDGRGEAKAFPVGLMDGGVFDNQGVDGVRTVYRRSERDHQPGLFLASDTSRTKTPMALFSSAERQGGPTLGDTWTQVKTWGWRAGILLILLLAISIAAVVWIPLARAWAALGAVALVAAIVLARLGWQYVWPLVQQGLGWIQSRTGVPVWERVRGIARADLARLVAVRVESVYALLTSVFGKRVRSLTQTSIFESDTYASVYADALITHLSKEGRKQRSAGPEPSKALRALIDQCLDVPTTLWASESDLKSLVAGGQANACHTLLVFAEKARSDPETASIAAELKAFWDIIQVDPQRFVRPVR